MKTIITEIPSHEVLVKGAETLTIGYPWLSLGAILALEHVINKDFKVLEFGSGGSTVFWAKNCKSVKSFETDPRWFSKTKKILESYKNAKITLGTQEEILKAVEKENDNYYDLVLVDSVPSRNRRLLFANAAVPKLKIGGWLVIDNYNRFSMNDFNYSKWKVYTYDEFGWEGQGTRLCKKIK